MAERPFLTARWERLVLLNYLVDPGMLQPHVPEGTELDTFEGRHYVSLVGFQFLDTRIRGIPVPFHHDFVEVNLRFYVRQGDRRGVVFLRELVPKRLVAGVANAVYHERYLCLPMACSVTEQSIRYQWSFKGNACAIEARMCSPLGDSSPGFEAEFITEHYWGYTRRRDGKTSEYRVTHPRWQVAEVEASFTGDAAPIYGEDFAAIIAARPVSALYANGSEVAVYPARWLF